MTLHPPSSTLFPYTTLFRSRPASGTHGGAHDHRNFPFAARHVMNLGGLIHHLVHDQRREVAEHDIDDRPHTRHRRADGNSGETGFRYGRVHYALCTEFLDQSAEDL